MNSVAVRFLLMLTPLVVWVVLFGSAEGAATSGAKSTGREVFLQNCAACHVNGVAQAPRVGNHADWDPRLAAGRQNLLNSVLRGKGGMPPKGGNASISDAQAAAGLDYMLEQVADLKAQTRVAKGQ